ncbi:MAG: hypothetical protein KIT58_02025 [Planctomycetota bacterium]|nr:hypothetical protein [Planctomycetota bacterium]
MGARVVGAGKTVALTVRTSGIDDGEAAEIQVFKAKDNQSLDTISAKVKNKAITADWVAQGPDPDGDEASWEVYYKATCKGLETQATKLVVYCDWVEVTSEDEEGNSLPDACFRVTAGQETRERNTGSSGTRKEEYLPPGPIEVEWLKPYHLVEWLEDKGPKRRAKVKKVPPARLVWPPKGAHTQWVNMPEDDAHPEQGHVLKVKVTLEGGKAGDKVYAKLTPAEDNSARNDPAPEIKDGTTADWCPDGGIEAELSEDDGEVELEVDLGLAGGDVFVLAVGGTQDCDDEALTITNWRRLFYQVTRAPDSAFPATAVMEAALKDVFIEYERYHEALIAPDDVPAGSFMSAGDLGRGSGKLLVVGDHNIEQLKGKFQDDRAPIGAHVIVCDAQYDGGEAGSWHEQTIEAEAVFGRKTLTISDPEDYDVFATAIQNGEASLQAGSAWESLAPSGHPDAGKRGDLTADMVVFGLGTTRDKVQVVLPPEAAQIVGEGDKASTSAAVRHPVKVTLKLLVARGPFLGEATGKHQLVVRLPSDPAMNGVLVHELGHAIKQALAEVAPGLSEADHGRTYTEHGHYGHHCAFGLSDAEFGEPDFTWKEGACVMFGAGTGEVAINDGKFCERCRPFVLAEPCDLVDSDGGKQVLAQRVEGDTDDSGSRAAPTYRVTLSLGDLDALCDPPDTDAGRQQRAQVLGLFYEPLGSGDLATRWGHAWSHWKDVLSSPAADDAAAQQALVDGMGKDVVKVAGAADDAASALPGPTEFARIRLPGGFAIRPEERSAWSGRPTRGPGHKQRFDAEEELYAANWRVGALPIVAKVEQQAAGSEEWSPAPGVTVHFQLAMPDALPEGSPARAPALRDQTRAKRGRHRGPAGYVERELATTPAVAGDPQADNCPVTRGGKRRPGAGQATDYFETVERPGLHTRGGEARFAAAQASRHPLAVMVTTNDDGEAGVIFRPSRQGGDRFKLRAFVDPIGEAPSDGTGADAAAAETGTLVVWRNLRLSKYVVFDYPTGTTPADRTAAGGDLAAIDFATLRDDFENCYMELIVERTASRTVRRVGDALWQQAVRHAQRNTPAQPARVSQRYDIAAMFPDAATTPGMVEMRQPAGYEAAKGGAFPSVSLAAPRSMNAATRNDDWALLLGEFLERFMEFFTRRALSGLVVVQAPHGDSITHATRAAGGPVVELTTSGQAMWRRGCYVWWGRQLYTQFAAYDTTRNALHELGHVVYLPHQWTTRNDVIDLQAGTTAGGPFQVGERVTESGTGNFSPIHSLRNGGDRLLIGTMPAGVRFTAGSTITGGTSGATATVRRFDTGSVGGGVPPEHDYADYCIMSYQRNVRNDYDFCGRCNLKLRGWDTSAVPLNNNLA